VKTDRPVRLGNVFLWHPDFLVHILSSWVKIRLHTENQFPRLSGSGLKVNMGGKTPITLSPIS
jgi:hypothetical protein